LKVFT